MQVHQTAQDLPRPALQHIVIDVLVPFAVPAAGNRTRLMCVNSSRKVQLTLQVTGDRPRLS